MGTIRKTFRGPGTITLRAVDPDGRVTAEPVQCGRGALVEVDAADPVLARYPERFGEPGCLDSEGRSTADALREELETVGAELTRTQARAARYEGYLVARGIDPDTGALSVQGGADEPEADWRGWTVIRKRALASQLGITGMSSATSAALDEAIAERSATDITEAIATIGQ